MDFSLKIGYIGHLKLDCYYLYEGYPEYSFVCEYCRCSAAVTMVRMRAELFDSLLRHGRNLQTFEQCLPIVMCVYIV
jgi:hypothetical protein